MRKSKINHESIAARGSLPNKKAILTKTAFAAIFILFITFPQVSFKGAAAGLSLWAKSILPGLFPAAVISSCIMSMIGGEYKHSKAVYAYIFSAGVLCGYPLGAMLCSEFHKLEPENDSLCEKIMAFCNISSPSFVVNYIFAMPPFLTAKKAKILFCIYAPVLIGISAVLILNMISQKMTVSKNKSNRKLSKTTVRAFETSETFDTRKSILAKIIDDAILNTVKNMLKLGGYIVIFSCIAAYIVQLPFPNGTYPAVLCGITEITNGIFLCSRLNISDNLIIILILAVNAFGGISTIMQTSGMIQGSGLSIKKYIYYKLIFTIITIIVSTAVIYVF